MLKIDKNLFVGKMVQVVNGAFEHYRNTVVKTYIDAKIIEIDEVSVKVETSEGKIMCKKHNNVYEARNFQMWINGFRKNFKEEEIRKEYKWYFENGFVK